MKVKLPTVTCKRCGHTWTPRTQDPRVCPDCKTTRFDSPRTGTEPGAKPKAERTQDTPTEPLPTPQPITQRPVTPQEWRPY